MKYLNLAENALSKCLTFKLERFYSFGYLLNGAWVNDIHKDYFFNEIENFKILLKKQLKYGKNQEGYLQKVGAMVKRMLDLLEGHKVGTIEFIQSYKIHDNEKRNIDKLPSLGIELYEQFKISLKEGKTDEKELFAFLVRYADNKLSYSQFYEFELGILNYAVWNYYRALNQLYSFVLTLQENARYIDFKNLDYEEVNKPKDDIKNNQLCHFNLTKKGVAQLFRILLEEKIVVVDEKDDRNNELQMKRFVQTNFTYQHPATGIRTLIETFNREYSEACNRLSPEKERHEKFIDNLIAILKQRKANLKK